MPYLPPISAADSTTRFGDTQEVEKVGPHVGSTSEACDKVEEVGNTSEVEEVGNTSEVEEVGGTQVGEVASPIEDSPELEHCRQLTMAANDDKDGNDGNDDNDDADIDSNDEGDESVTLSKIQLRIAAWLEIIPNHKHARTLLVHIDRILLDISKSTTLNPVPIDSIVRECNDLQALIRQVVPPSRSLKRKASGE